MYSVIPVARAHTPFKEKFGIPRQPMLAPAATGIIELLPCYNHTDALVGLEGVSHIWLLFLFHQSQVDPESPRLKVRPPRLGGNRQLGVFATRSNFRPNGIGQSLVCLDQIEGTRLHVSGVDLLDQTPIIDIKPYVPYSDAQPMAVNPIAPEPPALLAVDWEPQVEEQAAMHQQQSGQPIIALIEQCLAQDPRPAYQAHDPARRYATRLWDFEVSWRYPQPEQILVTGLH